MISRRRAGPVCRHTVLFGFLLAGMAFAVSAMLGPATAKEGPAPVRIAQASEIDFAIPAQSLADALVQFSRQTGIQVSSEASVTRDLDSPGVSGRMTAEAALRRLLAGSGISYTFVNDNSVALERSTSATSDSGPIRLDPITVEGRSESAYGPVDGYLAERSATATKTDTPIRDIPNSIQVVPRQVIEDEQAIGLEEVLDNAAGVTYLGNDASRGLNFSVRGFENAPILRDGFNFFGFAATPAEVEVANIERAEVIRGPSVLYGRSEPGGAVNLVTKRPLDEPTYNLEFQAGNRRLVSPIIDLSGPVTEDGELLYRFVGLYRREDSFQDYDESFKRSFVAPSVTWRPTDRTDLTLRLEYTRDKDPYVVGLPAIGDGVADIPFDRVMNNPDDTVEQETLIAGYEVEHRFGEDWKLRNQFAYVEGTYDYSVFPLLLSLNESTGELNRIFAWQFNDTDTFTTDTNLQGSFGTGPFNHTALFGIDFAYAFEHNESRASFEPEFSTPINIFDPDYFAVPTPSEDDLPVLFGSRLTRQQLGVYLQDQIDILDNLFLVGGLRYDIVSTESKDIVSGQKTDADETAWSPRIGLVYRPIEPVSLYANYSKSFLPNFSTDASGDVLPPEEGESFEVGIKVDVVPGRLSSTLAFFDITKQNVATADPVIPNASVATGEQRSRGFDIDLTGEILPGWNAIASYAFIDAEVTEDNTDIVGNELQGIPRHSASLWTTYEIQSGPLKGLGAGVGFNYVGKRAGDLDNTFEVDDYFLTNAALSYHWENWQFRLNAKNIFDIDYIESVAGGRSRQGGSIPGAPFTVRASVSVTF